MSWGFEGLEGQVSGKSPTEEVRDWCSERVEGVEKEEEHDRANDGVSLGNLGALFQSSQHLVLIELSSIV